MHINMYIYMYICIRKYIYVCIYTDISALLCVCRVFDANAGNTALYVNTLQPLVLSSTEVRRKP